jgi:hypothetical protein
VEFCSDFFVVNNIEINQLSLRPLKILNFLVKIHSKMCVSALVEQQMHNNFYFWEKTITLK